MYEYTASVIRVIDGDTVDVSIDLGFSVTIKQRVRLLGINAPEKNTSEGLAASQFLTNVLLSGSQVTLRSRRPQAGDKYGRYLASIDYMGADISQRMITQGYAVAWDGKGIKPV